MDQLLLDDLKQEYDRLSADGFRVLALAYSDSAPKSTYSKDDEHNLILKGYVAFLDPPKETAGPAITALQHHGIAVKVLTGDNELVSRKICKEVGLPLEHVLTGPEVENMSDADWPKMPNAQLCLCASRPLISNASSRLCKTENMWSVSWGTVSMTLQDCAPPTWAYRSIPP